MRETRREGWEHQRICADLIGTMQSSLLRTTQFMFPKVDTLKRSTCITMHILLVQTLNSKRIGNKRVRVCYVRRQLYVVYIEEGSPLQGRHSSSTINLSAWALASCNSTTYPEGGLA